MQALQVTRNGPRPRCSPCGRWSGRRRVRGRSSYGWAPPPSTSTTSTGASASWSRYRRRRPTRWAWTSAARWSRPERAPRPGSAGGWWPSPPPRSGASPSSPSADAVSVFDAPDGLDDAEATAFILHLPGLAPGTVPPGAPGRRRDAGRPLGGQRARLGRDPVGQGGRGTGDRRGGRTREGRVLHGAGRRPGHRPHHRGLRRGGAGRHRRRGCRRRLRPGRG